MSEPRPAGGLSTSNWQQRRLNPGRTPTREQLAFAERERLQVVNALLVERAAVEKEGDAGRLELINEQLRLHGHEGAE